MRTQLPWLAASLGAALVGLGGGCDTSQNTARQQAVLRWNDARGQVKAQLASDQFEAGNLDAAAGELAEADRLMPDNPRLVPLRARVWLAEGRTNEAAELLERTQLDGPAQAEIEYLLGIVRQQQGRWEEALNSYQRAADLAPETADYLVAVAQLLLQLGQPQDALRALAEGEPRFGWTDAYQATLAECHEQLGDWSTAASAWQRVVSGEQTHWSIRARLGEALYRARRYAEAIPVLQELAEDPEAGSSVPLRLMLAESCLAQGRFTVAAEQTRTALRWEPDNVQALRMLARSLEAGGEHAAALRAARRAQAVNARDIQTLELVAALAWRAGDYTSAAATIEQLLAVDPQNPVGLRLRERARFQVDQTAPE